ncbi:MAG: ABC transporter permease subunit [Methanobacteriota archaeon]|nr:MAG: ABC transporter permease subunit [Euryarchaeota archaeon]
MSDIDEHKKKKRPTLARQRHGLVLMAFTVLMAAFASAVLPAPALAAPPIADAGSDQIVEQYERVTFDGSGSTDDVGIVNYTWSFIYGDNVWQLYGEVNDSFYFIEMGNYTVTLNVTDGDGESSTDEMIVTVIKEKVNFIEDYWWSLPIIGATITAVVILWIVLYSGLDVVSVPTREKSRLLMHRFRYVSKQVVTHKMGAVGTAILGFFFALAVFGPLLAPYSVDPASDDVTELYLKPSPEHWMGTDSRGVDIYSQLLHGARTSIIVGIFAAIIASLMGAAIGLYSGYIGGWQDEVIMRVNDVILSIPWLVLMILLAAMVGEITLTLLIVIIGVTGWSGTARLVRAQVMSLRERMYVERARAIGSGDMHIINKHIMPNAFPLIFANTILTVAISILSEATLSFLRMRPVGTTTWGTMLSYAEQSSALQSGLYWWIIAPGLCIVFLVLGFTLLGHALDEVVNPRLRRR